MVKTTLKCSIQYYRQKYRAMIWGMLITLLTARAVTDHHSRCSNEVRSTTDWSSSAWGGFWYTHTASLQPRPKCVSSRVFVTPSHLQHGEMTVALGPIYSSSDVTCPKTTAKVHDSRPWAVRPPADTERIRGYIHKLRSSAAGDLAAGVKCCYRILT